MCLKVVIEDQIEDTKFAKEKFKKNTFSAYTLIEVSIVTRQKLKLNVSSITSRQIEILFLIEVSIIASRQIELCGSTKISSAKKFITYSFEARIKIHLNQYLKDIISHLLEGVFFFEVFQRENTLFMRLGFCNKVFSILPNQRILAAFLIRLQVL